MQHDPYQLSERFLKAVDNEFNVINMPEMLAVLSLLEKCTTAITKEVLEATRIGRHVNDMRRKASDKKLAARAKNLVKRWQSLLIPSASSKGGIGVSQLSHSATASGRINGQHLPRTNSVPSTLSSANSKVGTILSGTVSSQRPAVKVIASGVVSSPGLRSTSISHDTSTSSVLKHPLSEPPNVIASGRKRRLKDEPDELLQPTSQKKSSVDNGSACPIGLNGGSYFTKSSRSSLPQTSPRTPSLNVCTPPLHRTTSPASVGSEQSESSLKLPPAVRTSKVRSTAEILENVISCTGLNLSQSETARKVALNQIVKEKDEVTSIVPAGARPRPRKKPTTAPPPTSEAALNKNKHDMMHKFLASAADTTALSQFDRETPSPPTHVDYVGDTLSRGDSQNSWKDTLDGPPTGSNRLLELIDRQPSVVGTKQLGGLKVKFTLGTSSDNKVTIKKSETPAAKEPTLNTVPTLEELVARLPPIDVQTPIEEESYEVVEPASPSRTNIARLNDFHWEGVNGSYDYQNNWRRWTQSYTAMSYRHEPLHLLPYVNINDEQLFLDI